MYEFTLDDSGWRTGMGRRGVAKRQVYRTYEPTYLT